MIATSVNGRRRRATNPLRDGLAERSHHRPVQHRLLRCERRLVQTHAAAGDLLDAPERHAAGRLCAGRLFAHRSTPTTRFRKYCLEQLDAVLAAPIKSRAADCGTISPSAFRTSRRISTTRKHFVQLKEQLAQNDAELGTGGNHLFYLSTPPPVFPEIVKHLKNAGLDPAKNTTGLDAHHRREAVRHRPRYGARAADGDREGLPGEHRSTASITTSAKSRCKTSWRCALPIRSSNRSGIATTCRASRSRRPKPLGVEERGGYYDNAGALRDMIQNHVINLLALVAMEPPISADADAIRNEKYQGALGDRSRRRTTKSPRCRCAASTARAASTGQAVRGYREEDDVEPDSNTETFAAVKFFINNWRWAGVPFCLRSGKRLARKVSEIAVTFNPIPHRFYGEATDAIEPNVLVLKIQPDEGIAMRFEAKVPGAKDHVRSVYMDFNYGTRLRRRVAAGVRAADRRRDARRSNALHALGRRRARVGAGHADPRRVARQQGFRFPELSVGKPRPRRAERTLLGLAHVVRAAR